MTQKEKESISNVIQIIRKKIDVLKQFKSDTIEQTIFTLNNTKESLEKVLEDEKIRKNS